MRASQSPYVVTMGVLPLTWPWPPRFALLTMRVQVVSDCQSTTVRQPSTPEAHGRLRSPGRQHCNGRVAGGLHGHVGVRRGSKTLARGAGRVGHVEQARYQTCNGCGRKNPLVANRMKRWAQSTRRGKYHRSVTRLIIYHECGLLGLDRHSTALYMRLFLGRVFASPTVVVVSTKRKQGPVLTTCSALRESR